MKKMGTFAKVLIGVVIVLFIGLAFRRIWGPVAYGFIAWICEQVGITPPEYLNNVLNNNYVSGKAGSISSPD